MKSNKSPENPTSYRSISLLPTFSKIFKKILLKKLIYLATAANITQFGFRAITRLSINFITLLIKSPTHWRRKNSAPLCFWTSHMSLIGYTLQTKKSFSQHYSSYLYNHTSEHLTVPSRFVSKTVIQPAIVSAQVSPKVVTLFLFSILCSPTTSPKHPIFSFVHMPKTL